MATASSQGPISPDPVDTFGSDHLPAYVSNGVVGLRVLEVPFRRGVAVLNGLAATHPALHLEYSPYAPYPLAGDVAIGSSSISRLPHEAHPIDQRYDFACGELHSRWYACLDGVRVDASTMTFASRTHPSVVGQETVVHVDQPCQLRVAAAVTVDGVPGECTSRCAAPAEFQAGARVDGWLRFEPPGGLSACGIALHTDVVGAEASGPSVPRWVGEGDAVGVEWSIDAVPGRPYSLRQLVSLVSTINHHQPELQAARLVGAAADLGFAELRHCNREEWAQLWKGRPLLVGASTRWQALADAAFFYLQAAAHASSPASTHIFGMGQWPNYHYYYGHVMWDLEAFAVPVLALTQPGAAYALLDYRSRNLDSARQNARSHGRRGVQIPWEAGPSSGQESAPLGGLAVSYEDHGSLSVALAFAHYVHVTGDERFDADRAWPVLAEIAEWITSRVQRSARGYEVRKAMGVAERTKPADNQAYLNMGASVVLREAADAARRRGFGDPQAWRSIADQLVVPFDEAGTRIITHDGFDGTEEKAATPEPPAGLTLYGYPVEEAVERATLEHYLDLADDYLGSPMLSALYGVWAARLGDRRRAAALFDEGFAKFVSPRFMNIHEYRQDKFPEQPVAGPFVANLAGFLFSCLLGLTRLRPNDGAPSEWCQPGRIVLPEGWEAIEVDRLWVRGRPARLCARHGDDHAQIDIGPAEHEEGPST
jgi:Glycosyl hydrolase family 65 central catalytic domain